MKANKPRSSKPPKLIKNKWGIPVDPTHFLTGRKRSPKSIAKYKATMKAKREARIAAGRQLALGPIPAKLNGEPVHMSLDAIPDVPQFLRRQARPKERGGIGRDLAIEVAAGSQMTFILGDMRLTVRAV